MWYNSSVSECINAFPTSVSGGNCTLATYTYTSRNNYLSSIDYGNNDSVKYEYDKKGRLTEETYEDGDTVAYSYDSRGARAKVYDSATGITTTNYYDFTGRLMKYIEKGSGRNHSVGYVYNEKNNLTELAETFGSTTRTTTYDYDDDNRVETVTNGNTSITYSYDVYGRVAQQVTKIGNTVLQTETFTYVNPTATTTSAQIATHTIDAAGPDKTFTYTYDDNGNITSISDGTNTITYTYDTANQLLSEDNPGMGYRYEWIYDDAGNIQNRKRYTYQDGQTEPSLPETVNYGYYDTVWGDLLTKYNGEDIYYDDIGNLTDDGVWNYEWEHGRELATMTEITSSGLGDEWTYTYDANDMRTKRTNGTDTYTYFYNGSQLTRMTKGSSKLDFSYDAAGKPLTVTYNQTTYYYVTNIQGDVIALVDGTGATVAEYTYDAWGNLVSASATTICQLNPLRYRGYVYDTETELYYLQSRYYNPEMGRFINADHTISGIGGDIRGYNLFAYCFNNPVNMSDSSGNWPMPVKMFFVVVTVTASIVANHIVNAVNKKKIDKEIKETYNVDTATQEINAILEPYGDNVYADFTEDGVEITNSIEVNSKYDRQKISAIISRTENLTERSAGNLSAEWLFHNIAYDLHIQRASAINACLDYSKDDRWYVVGPTKLLEIFGKE